MVNPIPEGTRTVTPHLVVRGADRAIEFYKQAFGAVEVMRMPSPDGMLMHAELRIGDSVIYLADENPGWGAISPLALGGSPVSIYLYVPDADASFERAVQAGATVRMPISDAFWGDRYGQLGDPFGHIWSVATHTEDLTPEETDRRVRETFAAMASAEPEPAPRPASRRKGAAKKPARKKRVVKKKTATRKHKATKKKASRKPARRTAKKKASRKKTARRR